jgi:hypothetical protein
MVSLALGNIVTLGKNITQIDMLKGTFKMTDKDGTHPNPYNLGFLTNLANHFEGELWKIWWPTELIPRFDATRWIMMNSITDSDKKTLF